MQTVTNTREVSLALPDLAEATGVPAAVICRYVELGLLPVRVAAEDDRPFTLDDAEIAVVLRAMDLLNFDIRNVRSRVERFIQGVPLVDDMLIALAEARLNDLPEMRDLLPQLQRLLA
ncbi:hypothetical protein [Zhihengliuella halotolerans]|uniref:hypothetical protein n=1 Tax=Zhihengliuella halotolerans TaxID=370736 RepID=UPI0011AEF8A3|nr:hypothetical protein [Zhihengliuella halotolerans]